MQKAWCCRDADNYHIYYCHVRRVFWSVWDVCGELLHASFSLRLDSTFMASTCFQMLLQGPKVSLIHQEMYAIQQSAAYGRKSASKANQEWRRRRRYLSCKHAIWSTISSAVRNLMIKTDRMLSVFQPAAIETFICGGWGMGGEGEAFSLGEGTSASISFYLHHSNLFFTFMLRVQIWDMLWNNVDVYFPAREKTSCFDV